MGKERDFIGNRNSVTLVWHIVKNDSHIFAREDHNLRHSADWNLFIRLIWQEVRVLVDESIEILEK